MNIGAELKLVGAAERGKKNGAACGHVGSEMVVIIGFGRRKCECDSSQNSHRVYCE